MVINMLKIDARDYTFRELNSRIKGYVGNVSVVNCFGERFMCTGLSEKSVLIEGTPGNALASYMDGAEIEVRGNVQDAVGDTMNDGKIVVHGGAGDALGYAMRGGKIFVRDDAGYRIGIHMKQYKDKCPAIVIGGKAGSFTGEYLAGGKIVILGIGCEEAPVGNFTGVGMHGGAIYMRSESLPQSLPEQVLASVASEEDIEEISALVEEYCGYFGMKSEDILKSNFYKLTPNESNPYKQLYTFN